ncbi:MAG: DUF1573 domain-containing protein [Bacteroidetes bacterium]|nr:DUF1573 domain-containing protein [Bacteroidota bacterium]MBS1940676.1 DUF1573 domain-containing protein [Bacteroidota bacterium]
MEDHSAYRPFQFASRTGRHAGLAVLIVATLASCRITDHSENEPDEVTPNDMHIPASGYKAIDKASLPVMTFDSTARNMGRIAEGAQVEKTYGFVNTGKTDLVITDVRASCGCTVAKGWPRMPVQPGQSGIITVQFNSEGRPGKQHKTITVVANTDPPTSVLTLSGEVVSPSTETK